MLVGVVLGVFAAALVLLGLRLGRAEQAVAQHAADLARQGADIERLRGEWMAQSASHRQRINGAAIFNDGA